VQNTKMMVMTVTSQVTLVRLLCMYRVGPPSVRNASNQPTGGSKGNVKSDSNNFLYRITSMDINYEVENKLL